MLRRAIVATALVLAGADTPHGGRISFDIPAGPAIDSLEAWSRQAHMQMLYDYQHLAHVGNTRPVSGDLDKIEALRQVTAGTRLRFYIVNGRTVVIDANP